MKNQCFGGEYIEEVFDHVVKKMSYRRHKRSWNAYILFYTKEDIDVSNRMSDLTIHEPVPAHVQPVFGGILPIHEETDWLSYTVLFCYSKIPSDKSLSLLPSLDLVDIEELALLSAKIGVRFLFTICLHTKKSLRGVASDWYEALLGP